MPLRVLVTGATGFVGQHAVAAILAEGHQVIALSRNPDRYETMPWRHAVQHVSADVHDQRTWTIVADLKPDVLVHLAWPGLPNYSQAFHYETTLPRDFAFLKRCIQQGVRHLLVSGTGAEFGLLSGALHEDDLTAPSTAYGIAKDSLRRFLTHLSALQPFTLQWARLFHLHGPGQYPESLLAKLDRAIDEGAPEFSMSAGEQLRDYIDVREAARRIAILVDHPEIHGAIHCSSGQPVSVRGLVEARIKERGAAIKINLGDLPYPTYEPMAYWGVPGRLSDLVKQPSSALYSDPQ